MILDVHREGVAASIGKLTRDDRYGRVSFQYAENYLADGGSAISLALPLQGGPFEDMVSRAFFANLLPENDQLDQIREREGLDADDIVGLLYHLGADCSGALSCLPEGSPPVKTPGLLAVDYDFVSQAEIGEIVRRLAERQPLDDLVRDPSPVAGVQRKVALVALPDGTYAFPKSGRRVPTTHILKAAQAGKPHEPTLEFLSAELARDCGLAVCDCEVKTFGDYPALLIRRFDRTFTVDGRISRIHQEDFAQALGLPPRLKYERRGQPGLSYDLAAIVTVLNRCSAPAAARREFLLASLFNLAIGNNDNHAKNHALLYPNAGAPQLAPLYDLNPIKLDPQYTEELAFNIGAAKSAADLTVEDYAVLFNQLGLSRGAALRFANGALSTLLRRLDKAANDHLSKEKPFHDLVATEARRIIEILELDVEFTERDTFQAAGGGWATS
jgi:serine/threonine-protein kinase HipA